MEALSNGTKWAIAGAVALTVVCAGAFGVAIGLACAIGAALVLTLLVLADLRATK